MDFPKAYNIPILLFCWSHPWLASPESSLPGANKRVLAIDNIFSWFMITEFDQVHVLVERGKVPRLTSEFRRECRA